MATFLPTREQLALLREARVHIKHEFGESLQLSADDVFEQLYRYAIRSKTETLFSLHSQLVVPVAAAPAKQERKAMYRGAPV